MSSAVLLIDPDSQSARTVSDVFAHSGLTVTHVSDAEQAAFRLREQLPSAIVLEWLFGGAVEACWECLFAA